MDEPARIQHHPVVVRPRTHAEFLAEWRLLTEAFRQAMRDRGEQP